MEIATRTPNNVCSINETKEEKCCMGKIDENWLWYRRMGHMRFDNLVKVRKKQVVRDMPKSESLQILFVSNVNMGRKQK